MNTLKTTGFKDPTNGRTYLLLEGKHTLCGGHKLCEEIHPNARLPIHGEKASDDILSCNSKIGTWITMNEEDKERFCEDGETKPGIIFRLSDSTSAPGLGLYTFSADRIANPNKENPIICVYED